MQRDSMVFYRSFAEGIADLEEKDQLEAFWNIINYGLDGVEPDRAGPARSVYRLARPQIDSNNARYQNGLRGGRKKTESEPNNNQNGTEEEPKVNQKRTKSKPNENVNENVNENDSKNIHPSSFDAVWSAYPRKKEKAAALKAYTARIREGEFSEDELLLAVKRYAQDCRTLGTEERYIKHGSTFFGPNKPFKDYLSDDYKSAKTEVGNRNPNRFKNFEERENNYENAVYANIRKRHGKEETGDNPEGH